MRSAIKCALRWPKKPSSDARHAAWSCSLHFSERCCNVNAGRVPNKDFTRLSSPQTITAAEVCMRHSQFCRSGHDKFSSGGRRGSPAGDCQHDSAAGRWPAQPPPPENTQIRSLLHRHRCREHLFLTVTTANTFVARRGLRGDFITAALHGTGLAGLSLLMQSSIALHQSVCK
jgi:hypothetical protein